MSVETEGFREFEHELATLKQRAKPLLNRAMEQSVLLLLGNVQEYPPQPSRFRAKSFNTYVRGRGRVPIAMLKPDAKSRGGKGDMSSQQLGKKWVSEVKSQADAVLGIIGNSATYADYVQGKGQVSWHKETGWTTIRESFEREEKAIDRLFEEALEELIR
jgi:hypothetical protein